MIEQEDGVATVSLGDTIVVLWREPASIPRWKWVLKRAEALAAENPQGILVFYLILGSSNPPDAKTRSVIQEDFRKVRASIRKFVVVPIGNSVWMMVVRTVARTILMLSGLSSMLELSGSIAEGITQLRRFESPQTPAFSALEKAANELHAALRVTPAGASAKVTHA